MLTERLELLLQTKSFAELTTAEQTYVLQYFSVEEYGEMHLLLGMGTAALRDVPHIDKGVERRLQNHLEHVWQTPKAATPTTWWQAIFNYKIPLWQTALGAFALLFYFNFNGQRPLEIVEVAATPEKVYVYQVDTVFKEKERDTVQVKQATDRDTAVAQFPVQRTKSPRVVNVKPSLERNVAVNATQQKVATATVDSELPPLRSDIPKYEGFARGRSAESDSSLFQLIGSW